MPLNPMALQIINMIRQGQNPQQVLMQVLSSRAKGNPVAENLLALTQKGDGAAIENIARNMFKAQGLDFDSEFNSFRQSLGI